MQQSLDFLFLHLDSNDAPLQHCVINAGKVVLAESNLELSDIINQCSLINADGMSIVWAARILGYRVPERVTGIDLMHRMLARAAQTNLRIFLLGAESHVVRRAAEVFADKYPGLNICGVRDGFWMPNEEAQVVREVAATRPDILLLGFSSPKKEVFAHAHLCELGARLVFGVGGTFDVVAGITNRAPLWMQRSGLEWLYRFGQEPRRMFRRYVVGNTLFLTIVLRQRISLHRQKQ